MEQISPYGLAGNLRGAAVESTVIGGLIYLNLRDWQAALNESLKYPPSEILGGGTEGEYRE